MSNDDELLDELLDEIIFEWWNYGVWTIAIEIQ